jgi:hypothetical protein
MIRYRLYTEDIEGTKNIIDNYFKGYTIYKGIGVWKGKQEVNLTIEIIVSLHELVKIRGLVNEIKRINKQEAVLFTSEEVTSCLI